MFLSLQEVMQWIYSYKYFILYPVMVVEGPIVTVIAGLLVSLGHLNGLATYMILVAGDVTGDSLYYVMGRSAKKLILNRWRQLLGVTEERIGRLKTYFFNTTR